MVQFIDADRAVREIVTSTKKRRDRDQTATPFFFIIGAGISAPHVPVATAIEKLCGEAAERDGVKIPADLPSDPMERYERMLTLVHPNAADRQEFLHQLIRDAPISPANLRLAHILESKLLTNLVVTPNFDEMLSKALRLFGVDSVVCDHPKTTQRIDPNRTGIPQIVHVHGTHWFYDCCNLKGEITLRATTDDSENVSMADLLNRILATSSPIVAGYSGWKDDVIMTALWRWLRTPVKPHNIYWFCYRASDAESLPDWLKNHGSVRIIAPAPGEEPLDARIVFEKLILALGAPAPRITSNPLGFLAEQLERELGLTTSEDAKDIYLIRQVISRVRRGVELEAEERERQTVAAKRTAEAVERINDAMRRAAYDEALAAIAHVDVAQLQDGDVPGLLTALAETFNVLVDREPRRVLHVCELWCAAGERSLAKAPGDEELEARVCQGLSAKAICYEILGRTRDAFSTVDALVERFGASSVIATRRHVISAMANRARSSIAQDDHDAAGATLAEIERRFGGDDAIKPQVRGAQLYIRVAAEKALDRVVALCDDFLSHHGSDDSRSVQQITAFALGAKASALYRNGQNEDAKTVAEELINRFGDTTRFNIRAVVADAYLTGVSALIALGDFDGAQTTLKRFEQRFSSDESGWITSSLHKARVVVANAQRASQKSGKRRRSRPPK